MTWKIIKLSLKSIFNNKMRSFLTMLGIIIGVMAVVILVSITKGAASGITDSISDMGSQLITASVTDSETTVSAEEGTIPLSGSRRTISRSGTLISSAEGRSRIPT